MTRLIYNKLSKTFDFQDKFLWFWVDKTAKDDYGNDLPCTLTGFSTLQEAMANAQSSFYLHKSCFPYLNEFSFLGTGIESYQLEGKVGLN